MPVELEFDANGVAWLRASGEVTFEHAIASVRRLYSERRFVAPTRALLDLRDGKATLSSEEIRRFAAHVHDTRSAGRGRAAVVVGDDLTFGLCRMYEMIAVDNPIETQVFRDVDAATRWLAREF